MSELRCIGLEGCKITSCHPSIPQIIVQTMILSFHPTNDSSNNYHSSDNYPFNTNLTGMPIVFKSPVRTETHTNLKKLEFFPLSTENAGLRKSFPFSGFELLMRKVLANKDFKGSFLNFFRSSPLFFLRGSM